MIALNFDRCPICDLQLGRNGTYPSTFQGIHFLFERKRCALCLSNFNAIKNFQTGLTGIASRVSIHDKDGETIVEQSERQCPHCKSTSGIRKHCTFFRTLQGISGKKGRVKMQVYLCKCGKTYNAFTGTLSANRQYHPETLKIVIEFMIDGQVSQRYLAKRALTITKSGIISRQAINRILMDSNLNYYFDLWFFSHLPKMRSICYVDGTWPKVSPKPKRVVYTVTGKDVSGRDIPLSCFVGKGRHERSDEILRMLSLGPSSLSFQMKEKHTEKLAKIIESYFIYIVTFIRRKMR